MAKLKQPRPVTVGFKADPELYGWLRQYGADTQRNVSQVLRLAVQFFRRSTEKNGKDQ